ncbi:MAG: hypothetical protein WA624_08180 [Methylocella sp.]
MSLSYETRVLAFVDLLGFSKLVLTSPSNAEAMAKVVGVMNLLFKFEQENYELLQNHAEDVSFCSDCVVLSGSIDRLWCVFREIGKLARQALAIGVPCRGGVATDDCYHRRGMVVGPAMVTAYRLEQAAKHPRIVLDDGTVELWKAHVKDEINPAAWSDVVRLDEDGRWYINIFHQHFDGGLPWSCLPVSRKDILDGAQNVIGAGLLHPCPKIQFKYAWLNNEINSN